MSQQDIILQGPISSILIIKIFTGRIGKDYIYIGLRIFFGVKVHADYSLFFNPLPLLRKAFFFHFEIGFASAEFGKSCNYEVSNLLVVGVA